MLFCLYKYTISFKYSKHFLHINFLRSPHLLQTIIYLCNFDENNNMKSILFIALAMAFTSCEKCYQCTTTVTSLNTQGDVYHTSTSLSNFCGTVKEKTKHEKEGSHTENGYALSKTVTVISCVAE